MKFYGILGMLIELIAFVFICIISDYRLAIAILIFVWGNNLEQRERFLK